MYLSGLGATRLVRDLPMLQYHFGKIDDEGLEKLIAEADKPLNPNAPPTLRQRGWRVFIRNYVQDGDEADAAMQAEKLPMSVLGATALADFISSGELHQYPTGSVLWRLRLLPLWERLKATTP